MNLGMNIAGMEYEMPTQADLAYYAAKGFDHIRLTINWDLLQPTLNGALDPAFLAKVRTIVDQAKAVGLAVDLDIHSYGVYKGDLIGTSKVPISAFADMWGKLAGAFAHDDNVMFGLMNEPQLASASAWLPAVNAAIAAIRATGATQEVLVSGTYWDGGQSWTTTDNAKVLGAPGAIVDSAHNFAFEVHQYLDDTSGQNSWVVSESIGVERLQAITEWARASGAKLYLGEFGVADNAPSLSALSNMLSFVSHNQDVWQGGAYWGSGALPPGYIYAADPIMGMLDSAQMNVLEHFLDTSDVRTALGGGQSKVDTYQAGQTTPSVEDRFDAAGVLVSRTIFTATGALDRSISHAADGSWVLVSYNGTGGRFRAAPFMTPLIIGSARRLGRRTGHRPDPIMWQVRGTPIARRTSTRPASWSRSPIMTTAAPQARITSTGCSGRLSITIRPGSSRTG